jgi:hypothetical protein
VESEILRFFIVGYDTAPGIIVGYNASCFIVVAESGNAEKLAEDFPVLFPL